MSDLYPLLMKPYFDPRPWGARDLAPIYDFHVHPGEESIGEVWLTWDNCEVANGPLAGTKLGDLCKRFRRDLVGTAARETDRYPLLIKFLFPQDKLSVQVHPDDATAQKQGQPCGKTECWYVVQAEDRAEIALGLKTGTSREEFERSIAENRAEELLNWMKPKAGEMIFVDAGTVHTLGAGAIILETQQNSDITYRLYDYGRPRELHVKDGIAAMKESTAAGVVPATPIGPGHERLVSSECFVVEKSSLSEPRTFRTQPGRSAQNLVAVDGCAAVETPGAQPVLFQRGEAIVIPAGISEFTVRPQWQVEFLKAGLP
ncbi:MAG TPA: type I phosphomannose isomerase catalytic subunit [Terriglobales bacterium]|nr:type I phosphomannose isomerase catalytic subunit [Terriglobales bacterium]